MTDPHQIARSLSDAQRKCLLALTPEWQGKGYSKTEADILWALDSRLIRNGLGPLVDCRIKREESVSAEYQHRLIGHGLAVRAIIEAEEPGNGK